MEVEMLVNRIFVIDIFSQSVCQQLTLTLTQP